MDKNNENKSFFSREEVEFTDLPFMGFTTWYKLSIDEDKVYLTKARCSQLGFPVKDDEPNVGFRYTTSGPGMYKYVPVYDRTDYSIDLKKLYEKELIESRVSDS